MMNLIFNRLKDNYDIKNGSKPYGVSLSKIKEVLNEIKEELELDSIDETEG